MTTADLRPPEYNIIAVRGAEMAFTVTATSGGNAA